MSSDSEKRNVPFLDVTLVETAFAFKLDTRMIIIKTNICYYCRTAYKTWKNFKLRLGLNTCPLDTD